MFQIAVESTNYVAIFSIVFDFFFHDHTFSVADNWTSWLHDWTHREHYARTCPSKKSWFIFISLHFTTTDVTRSWWQMISGMFHLILFANRFDYGLFNFGIFFSSEYITMKIQLNYILIFAYLHDASTGLRMTLRYESLRFKSIVIDDISKHIKYIYLWKTWWPLFPDQRKAKFVSEMIFYFDKSRYTRWFDSWGLKHIWKDQIWYLNKNVSFYVSWWWSIPNLKKSYGDFEIS